MNERVILANELDASCQYFNRLASTATQRMSNRMATAIYKSDFNNSLEAARKFKLLDLAEHKAMGVKDE